MSERPYAGDGLAAAWQSPVRARTTLGCRSCGNDIVRAVIRAKPGKSCRFPPNRAPAELTRALTQSLSVHLRRDASHMPRVKYDD